MDAYYCILLAVLHMVVVKSETPAVLSVDPVLKGNTATLECSSSNASSTTSFRVTLNEMIMYDCATIIFPCIAFSGDPDYSAVTFTGLDTASAKGTFTVKNADEVRDGGVWQCKYGSSDKSNNFTVVVSDTPPTTTTTTVSTNTIAPISEPNTKNLLFLLVLIVCVVLVVVIIIVSRYKTLVINTLYVKVTKNTVQLSWKPKFEPVPNTTYAKCAQNGLTENAEFIDGLFVVVFRDLTPERQHDVTVYCQNAADMKLYKSETCVVFTLKEYSNTNPKECNPVLALHSLDLTVYQKKVDLSWTSPLAFDSTKVEYWVGSDKHITISANKPSPATSTAEMTRLLPGRMITFTITGEKDGTKYPSGILHQKTLTDLTDCCP